MKRLLLLLVLFVAAPLRAQAPALLPEPLPRDPMKATIHRLDNGLTVYLSPNTLEPRVQSMIAVRTGAKEDPADSTGMAHYLEHMLFKGSQRLGTTDWAKEKVHLDAILALYEKLFKTKDPAARKAIYAEIDSENVKATSYATPLEVWKLYDAMGFKGTNAFTSSDYTVYVTAFPSNRAELWARVEADRFAHPVFRLFQTEIETVYEEKNRSLDNPSRILSSALNEKLFPGHPYGTEVLGTVEHLKNPSLAKMYAYYESYYRPSNMAIVLSGDFDRDAMLALIKKEFGAWQPVEPKPRFTKMPAPLKGTKRVEVHYVAEETLTIAWPTVPDGAPDQEALMVLDMVLNNSSAGLLDLRLNQAQKVKSASSSTYFRNKAGTFYASATPKKDQTLEQAEALLLGVIEDVKAGDFKDEDLKAILLNLEISEKGGLENNRARANSMMEAFLGYEEWPHRVDYLERMRAITKDDVVRVARRYLGTDRVIAYRREGKPQLPVIEKPSFTKVAIDAQRRSEFFKELAAIQAPPLQPKWLEQGRDYTITKAPWGRLYSAKNPVNDLFALSFNIERGKRHERQLCAATRLLERSGAGDMDVDAFQKALFGLGASLDVECGEQTMSVSLSGVDSTMDQALALVARHFEAPHIATDTLKKMKEVWIGGHKDNKKNPGYLRFALAEYATRGVDSTTLSELTDAEIEKLDETELRRLIGTIFDYQRRTEYVGVREPAALTTALAMGRTRFTAAPKRQKRPYVRSLRPRVVFTHRDMTQAQLGYFAPDVPADPALTVDAQFYNTYIDPLIWEEVRETRALAYSSGGGYTRAGRKDEENSLWGSAGCQADKTVEAASVLGGLLRTLPTTATRFKDAANEMEQTYRSSPTQFREIPELVISWENLGIRSDPRPSRFKKVLAYGETDLKKFAKRFETRPLTLYILGSRDKVDLEALKKLGDFEEKTIDQLFPY